MAVTEAGLGLSLFPGALALSEESKAGSITPLPPTGTCVTISRHFQRVGSHTLAKIQKLINYFWLKTKKLYLFDLWKFKQWITCSD